MLHFIRVNLGSVLETKKYYTQETTQMINNQSLLKYRLQLVCTRSWDLYQSLSITGTKYLTPTTYRKRSVSAHCLRRFSLQLAGFKAGRAGQKGLAEQRHSPHGSQEAEHDGKSLGRISPSRSHPQDPPLPTRPYPLIEHSAMNSPVNYCIYVCSTP